MALDVEEPPAQATVTLRLPSTAVHVRTARLVAAAMARRSGVDEALLDEVRLAVGEACARAVRLHERVGVTAPVTVEFQDQEQFVVAVVDQAPLNGSLGAPALGVAALDVPVGGRGVADIPADGAVVAGRPALLDRSGRVVAGDGVVVSAGTGSPLLPGSASTDAPWTDPTGDALGLALLAAVVADLSVNPQPDGVGTRVVMSWPVR